MNNVKGHRKGHLEKLKKVKFEHKYILFASIYADDGDKFYDYSFFQTDYSFNEKYNLLIEYLKKLESEGDIFKTSHIALFIRNKFTDQQLNTLYNNILKKEIDIENTELEEKIRTELEDMKINMAPYLYLTRQFKIDPLQIILKFLKTLITEEDEKYEIESIQEQTDYIVEQVKDTIKKILNSTLEFIKEKDTEFFEQIEQQITQFTNIKFENEVAIMLSKYEYKKNSASADAMETERQIAKKKKKILKKIFNIDQDVDRLLEDLNRNLLKEKGTREDTQEGKIRTKIGANTHEIQQHKTALIDLNDEIKKLNKAVKRIDKEKLELEKSIEKTERKIEETNDEIDNIGINTESGLFYQDSRMKTALTNKEKKTLIRGKLDALKEKKKDENEELQQKIKELEEKTNKLNKKKEDKTEIDTNITKLEKEKKLEEDKLKNKEQTYNKDNYLYMELKELTDKQIGTTLKIITNIDKKKFSFNYYKELKNTCVATLKAISAYTNLEMLLYKRSYMEYVGNMGNMKSPLKPEESLKILISQEPILTIDRKETVINEKTQITETIEVICEAIEFLQGTLEKKTFKCKKCNKK